MILWNKQLYMTDSGTINKLSLGAYVTYVSSIGSMVATMEMERSNGGLF
jgi:hypothetical protein